MRKSKLYFNNERIIIKSTSVREIKEIEEGGGGGEGAYIFILNSHTLKYRYFLTPVFVYDISRI